jgi:hypothetical protein
MPTHKIIFAEHEVSLLMQTHVRTTHPDIAKDRITHAEFERDPQTGTFTVTVVIDPPPIPKDPRD